MVYDTTDLESFNNVKQWLHEIDRLVNILHLYSDIIISSMRAVLSDRRILSHYSNINRKKPNDDKIMWSFVF